MAIESENGAIDALLVLNRGMDEEGMLSPDSARLAEAAIDIGTRLTPRTIMFSGSRAWHQGRSYTGHQTVAEAMEEHALDYAELVDAPELHTDIEAFSANLIETVTYGIEKLELRRGDRLGILGTQLPFIRGRVQFLSKLALPEIEVVPLPIRVPHSPREQRNEALLTLATRTAMIGVQPGDIESIQHRGRLLDWAYAMHQEYAALKDDTEKYKKAS